MSKELNKIQKEHDALAKIVEENESKIAKYMEDEIIREFVKLYQENLGLKENLEKISYQLTLQRMRECKHIFIVDSIQQGNNITLVHHCIKCSLNTHHIVMNKPVDELTPLELDMKSIYQSRKGSQVLSESCPLELAEKIYQGIKRKYPKITDQELIKYFNAALYNIKTKDAESHLKHLGLRKDLKL